MAYDKPAMDSHFTKFMIASLKRDKRCGDCGHAVASLCTVSLATTFTMACCAVCRLSICSATMACCVGRCLSIYSAWLPFSSLYAVNLVAALHVVLRVLGVLRGALSLRISHCMYYCACCIAASQIRWGNKSRCVVRIVCCVECVDYAPSLQPKHGPARSSARIRAVGRRQCAAQPPTFSTKAAVYFVIRRFREPSVVGLCPMQCALLKCALRCVCYLRLQ